jgi:Ferritin-like
MPNNPITTIPELHEHLSVAMQLEHATIPPYLLALYTIHPDTNLEATRILRTVVVEEMLHLTLAANICAAISGAPAGR